ncbi:MAG: glycine--tRNA ligase [Candidatus Aenigmatarchaeota archaeon]|nr:glycine--tRNA ligase [Candidatus Aenigmarchaeota archaeon]
MTVIEEVESMAKRRGFFWPAAQIYNPVSGFWNYGPLGTKLFNSLISLWKKYWIKDEDAYEINTTNVLPEIVWIASGHTEGFNDKQTLCEKCKMRWRADHLIEEKIKNHQKLEGKSTDELTKIIRENNIICPNCGGKLSDVFVFNLMYDIKVSPTGDIKCYLRPETTQSSVIDFQYVYKSQRAKLPVKIAQIGKSFRNEISPRQCLIRLREFWMAEFQIFFNPENTEIENYEKIKNKKINILPAEFRKEGKEKEVEIEIDEALRKGWIPNKLIAYYLVKVNDFFLDLGFDKKRIRFKELLDEEKAHYSKKHWDFEVYSEDFGWIECVNNAWRTDYDLSRHEKFSKQKLSVFEDNKHILPHLYEPSFGIDRIILNLLLNNWHNDGKRCWLSLKPKLAPYIAAVFPLVKKDGLDTFARKIYENLKKKYDVIYDESDSIGRRYARVDEIGVPIAITIDYDSLKNNTVTIRDRDTTKQERIKISDIETYIEKILEKN